MEKEMRKFKWLPLILWSSVVLEGCGMIKMSGSKQSINACSESRKNLVPTRHGDAFVLDSTNSQPDIAPFRTCENIYAYINERKAQLNCENQGSPKPAADVVYDDRVVAQGQASSASQVESSQKSVASNDVVTNLRERGVDEADMAKVSKDHIFVASSGQIAVLDRKSKQLIGLLKVSDSHPRSNIEPAMMYQGNAPDLLTKDDQLVVILGSKLQVYSLKAMSMPILKDEVALAQPASEVRLIGNRLVMLSNIYAALAYSGSIDDQMIRSLPCASTYPELIYNGTSHFGNGMTIVKSIDLRDLKNEKTFAFLQTYQSYITTKNIYLYSSYYTQDVTHIRKISLSEKGELMEVSTGSVQGQIKDSWALSESGTAGEFLSVVSTSSKSRSSQLAVLNSKDSKLTQVGVVGDFGVGEQVKSVRKIGDVVFVVTFRETDPLFAIDISNVSSPKILSALKIPGFSSYLHPFGSNRLIGLGSSGGNFDSSVQLSLFDTTTLTDVKRLDAITIGESGSSSLASIDYHAFFMDQENALVGFPVEFSSVHILNKSDQNFLPPSVIPSSVGADQPSVPSYGSSGAALYKIGPTSVKLFKFINHDDLVIKLNTSISSVDFPCPWSNEASRIKRLFKIDNQLVSISEGALKSFDLSEALPLAAIASWESNQSFCTRVIECGTYEQ
jgi:inhibitor of cysteine peptidase